MKPLDPKCCPLGISTGNRIVCGGGISFAVRNFKVSGGALTRMSPTEVVTMQILLGRIFTLSGLFRWLGDFDVMLMKYAVPETWL